MAEGKHFKLRTYW